MEVSYFITHRYTHALEAAMDYVLIRLLWRNTYIHAVPGKFLGIYTVGQDPSDSKSNRLHVDIFRFCFIHLRNIL
jgi:hypothetical protein